MNSVTKIKKPVLCIRYELFDHAILPLSNKLDDQNIIHLFRKLHIISTIEYKITLKEWVDHSTQNLGITEKEANILFATYKVLEENVPCTSNRYEEEESSSNASSIDLRYFALFFALQTYHQRSKIQTLIEKGDKNPSVFYHSSPLTSPRVKGSTTLRSQAALDLGSINTFIKSTMKLFLRLIASDIHNTETTLNSGEYNTLKFLFKFSIGKSPYQSTSPNSISNFSSLTPFFNNSNTRINIEAISDWVTSCVSNTEHEDYVQVKTLSKCVTIKDSQISNKSLRIIQCEDSHIYINTNVLHVKISNCINCVIFVAAVNKITTIDKCENCTITVASNLVKISNMIDCTVFLYAMTEPILFGDNRGLSLGPHNVQNDELITHIKNARLIVDHTKTKLFSNPTIMDNSSIGFTIVQPKDFSLLVTPFPSSEKLNLLLTPLFYVDVIEEREKVMKKIKVLIREAGLMEEQEKALHVALQGYFREWLVTSGNIKSITDIVKMIDYEN